MNENERSGFEKLEAAFRAVNAEEWEGAELSSDLTHSAEYERKMETLLREQKHPYLRLFNTVGKRVAVFVMAILLGFASTMSISAVRKPVVNFFIKAHENFLELFYEPEEEERIPEKIEEIYTLGVLPDESEWLTRFIGEKDVTTTWRNDDVNLTLVQTTLDARLFVNETMERIVKIWLDEKEITVIQKFGVTIYIWNTDEYAFHLVAKGDLTQEEMAQMVGSLMLDRTTQTR